MNTKKYASSTGTDPEHLEGIVMSRLGSRIRGLRLVFQHAGVVLRGWSESYHAKQVAQHAVMELTRVPILANEIEVA